MADETTPSRPRRTAARRPQPKTPKTNQPGLGLVLLAILLITAPLVGVLYLGAQLLRLPFPPFDLYDWPVRAGFAPWVSLATSLSTPADGGNIAQTAPLTQWLLGLTLFLALAAGVGLAFYAYTSRRGRPPDTIDGLTAGAHAGRAHDLRRPGRWQLDPARAAGRRLAGRPVRRLGRRPQLRP
jgi:hypothetical protein